MANELKPCPFCNSTDVSVNRMEKACMSWVSCKSCGLDTPSETGTTDDQAVSYWNTRPGAPVEGLDVVAYAEQFASGAIEVVRVNKSRHCTTPLVTRSQAEAIITAERNRAEVAEYKLDQAVNTVQPMIIQRAERAEADNAALTARVKEQVEHIATLDSDLEAMEKRAQEGETQLEAERKALEFISGIGFVAAKDAPAHHDEAVKVARAALEAKP